MRSIWTTLLAAAVALLVVPQFAAADDVNDQLRLMQERMSQLEEKLQATNDQLEAANRKAERQEKMIVDAGLEAREGSSGLSGFLSDIVIDGFVAASYNYNAASPKAPTTLFNLVPNSTVNGINSGLFGNVAPYHSNHNTFQVDQLWFGVEKPATAESRGGFRADIVYGVAADDARGGGFDLTDSGWLGDTRATGDLPHLFQAYAQYLAPITEDGILIKAGRYETLIGYERFRADQNFNITRGIVWTSLQPINHTGVLISGGCGDCGFDYSLGIGNNVTDTMADTDNDKMFIGRVRWTGETASIAISGLYGGDTRPFFLRQLTYNPFPFGLFPIDGPTGVGRDGDNVPLIDAVATWDPSENLSTYLNFTYRFNEDDNQVAKDWDAWGIAGGGRLAINDSWGVATRVEYLRVDNAFAPGGLFVGALGGFGSGDLEQYSVTATIDHTLAENLTVKVEGRWDLADVHGGPDTVFVNELQPFNSDDQWLFLAQLMYEF